MKMRLIAGVLAATVALAACAGAQNPNQQGDPDASGAAEPTSVGASAPTSPAGELMPTGTAEAEATTESQEGAGAPTTAPEEGAPTTEPEESSGSGTSPEEGAGAPTTVSSWQTVEVSDFSISLDVPDGWEQSSDAWEWAPAGVGAPRVGINSTPMDDSWTPSSMLPEGQVRNTEIVNLPWAQATVYSVETEGSDNVSATPELHGIVRGPNEQALDFYVIPGPNDDVNSARMILDHMLESVDTTGA